VLRRRFRCAASAAPPLLRPLPRHCRNRPYCAAVGADHTAPPLLPRHLKCAAAISAWAAPPSEPTALSRRFCCAAFTAPLLSPLVPRRRRWRPTAATPLGRRRRLRCRAAVGAARAAPPLPLRRPNFTAAAAHTGQPLPLVSAPPSLQQPLRGGAPVLCRSCFCSAVNTLAV